MDYLKHQGIKVVGTGLERVDYAQALEMLHHEVRVADVHVDSGCTSNGVPLRDGPVDELHELVHPGVLDRANQLVFFSDPSYAPQEEIPLHYLSSRTLDPGVLLLGCAVRNASEASP
jgi:riboflavin biosynthesis pyrimidine reductase